MSESFLSFGPGFALRHAMSVSGIHKKYYKADSIPTEADFHTNNLPTISARAQVQP